MATHSSILAWKIPWTVEPGRLQSMGLQRVRYDSAMNTLFFYILPILNSFHNIFCLFVCFCIERLFILCVNFANSHFTKFSSFLS